MKKEIPLSLWLVLAVAVQAQTSLDQLESELSSTTGRSRIGVLVQLTAAYRHDDPQRAVALGAEALELLQSHPDESSKLEILTSMASAYSRSEDSEAALEYGTQAASLARRMARTAEHALALRVLGEAHRRLNRPRHGLRLFDQSIQLFEQIGDESGVAEAAYLAGVAHWTLGNYAASIEYSLRSRQAFAKSGDDLGVGKALNTLGLVHLDLDQREKALGFYTRSLEIHQREGVDRAVARLLNNIGNIYRTSGDLSSALDYYFQSLEVKERLGDTYGIGNTLGNIGVVYMEQGDPQRALGYAERALEAHEELGEFAVVASSLLRIADVYRQLGDLSSALEAIDRSLALAREIGAHSTMRDGSKMLSEVYATQARFEQALDAFQRYEAIDREIHNKKNSEIIAEMQARYEAEEKDREIELWKQKHAVEALELERVKSARTLLIGGFGLAILSLLLIYSRYRWLTEKRLLKEERLRNKERERYIAELTVQKQEVEARNAEMERFAYTASHDLKTPLVTIKGFLGLLEEDVAEANSEQVARSITRIHTAADKMGRLLEELLDLSRVGRLVKPNEAVHLSELASEAARRVAGQIEKQGVSVDIDPAMPVVRGDRERLLEVYQNLIENAVKFMRDRVAGRIEIGGRQVDDKAHCFVRDNGIGIDPAYHQKIFGLFDQLNPNGDGTGLGLALVKRIIEFHGGRISVESEGRGRGSTFTFTLPLMPGDSSERAHEGGMRQT